MAIHLSAIKRARQNQKRRIRNVHVESTVKSAVKRVRAALEKKDVDEARNALFKAIPLIRKG
ncbi:MAG: 30S ribosomal protein S20, partial [Deltaproteobacteria bacterium RBG_13_52_11b]